MTEVDNGIEIDDKVLEDNPKEKLSREDLNLIFCGIRPKNLGYEEFKMMRSWMNRLNRKHLKGYLFHSSTTVMAKNDKGEDIEVRVPKGKGITYIKNKKEK